jgi:hypothetical protein
VTVLTRGPDNVVSVPEAQSRRKSVALCLGSPTSDRAVWGRSPDVPVWRDVIPQETEVAPGQDRPSDDTCKTRLVGGGGDRPPIGQQPPSNQFLHGCLFLARRLGVLPRPVADRGALTAVISRGMMPA